MLCPSFFYFLFVLFFFFFFLFFFGLIYFYFVSGFLLFDFFSLLTPPFFFVLLFFFFFCFFVSAFCILRFLLLRLIFEDRSCSPFFCGPTLFSDSAAVVMDAPFNVVQRLFFATKIRASLYFFFFC